MKTYRINEIFYSLQGEGVRAGTPNVFVRFAGCNLTCKQETHGFDCDTEFTSGQDMTAPEITDAINAAVGGWWDQAHVGVVFTGGEPALQLNRELTDAVHAYGYAPLAIETNGTRDLSDLGLDWITVSPKTAEHTLRQLTAHEVKYVRHAGQGLPKPAIEATHWLLSPASTPDGIDPAALAWCIQLCKANPPWRLSMQQHRVWGVR